MCSLFVYLSTFPVCYWSPCTRPANYIYNHYWVASFLFCCQVYFLHIFEMYLHTQRMQIWIKPYSIPAWSRKIQRTSFQMSFPKHPSLPMWINPRLSSPSTYVFQFSGMANIIFELEFHFSRIGMIYSLETFSSFLANSQVFSGLKHSLNLVRWDHWSYFVFYPTQLSFYTALNTWVLSVK